MPLYPGHTVDILATKSDWRLGWLRWFRKFQGVLCLNGRTSVDHLPQGNGYSVPSSKITLALPNRGCGRLVSTKKLTLKSAAPSCDSSFPENKWSLMKDGNSATAAMAAMSQQSPQPPPSWQGLGTRMGHPQDTWHCVCIYIYIYIHVYPYRGWMDGWMDGWKEGRKDRQTDRQTGRHPDRQTDRQTDGRTDGRTDRQTERKRDEMRWDEIRLD